MTGWMPGTSTAPGGEERWLRIRPQIARAVGALNSKPRVQLDAVRLDAHRIALEDGADLPAEPA